jgi:2-polyprenyl-3-methyl-5-hydroxy-6-metoxy-1,4-benzoquinol methylase
VNVDHKYQAFSDAPGSTHNLVVDLVPPKSRVLEFGCATGYMSEVLASRRGCSVVGIEVAPAAAEVARGRCEKVLVGDAETMDLSEALGRDRFDAILFADVLEHLRDPAALLKAVRPFLAKGGSVIASIPNIAHGSVRLALLHGEFRYRELGLLDNTHLRFFTRESVQDLFEESGYLIAQWVRQSVPVDQAEIVVPSDPLVDAARSLLANDIEATTYQFVVRAVPTTADRAFLRELAEAKTTLSVKERTIVELQAQLVAAKAQAARFEARVAEQSHALEASEAKVDAITSSRSWRVARCLSAARHFVAPANVWRTFVPQKPSDH